MTTELTRYDVKQILKDLLSALPREECRSCDCLQGFLTQLELDATEDITDVTAPLKVPKGAMHGCLGCDPCPPAEAFSAYIRHGSAS
jgi:hypothetical protein